jgi:hypothetical protein
MEICEVRTGVKFYTVQGVLEIIDVDQAGEFVVGALDGNIDYVEYDELKEQDLVEVCSAQ